jgi:hypothetical protein
MSFIMRPSRFAAAAAAADIRAAVGTSTSPTSTGTKAVTGVGFQPKVLLPFGVPGTADGANTDAMIGFGCGLSTSSRGAISVSSDHGGATSNTDRRHDDTKVFSVLDSGAVYEAADISSLDSDGFTLDWTSAAASANILNHICLGGDDLEASLTLHQMNGTNADESFAHGLTGGAPDALLFFSAINSTKPPNTSTVAAYSMGAWSGANQFASSVGSRNNVTTTNTCRALFNDCVISEIIINSNTVARNLAVSAVDATNVDATYTVTTNAEPRYFFMLALRGCKAQVGTFDCNGSTDPLTISTPGITPKLFLPVFLQFGVDNLGSVTNNCKMHIGASDGTNTVSCGITDRNNLSTTDAARYQSSSSLEVYRDDSKGLVFDAIPTFSGESVIITPSINGGLGFDQGAYLVIGN